MQVQPIESLTREQAIEMLRAEKATSEFLRSKLAELWFKFHELEKQLESVGAGGVGALMGE